MNIENKMGSQKMNKLNWTMGLPMVLSMVLQAIYNVVDTIFVVNKEGLGSLANQALTYAFPIQIFMIAIGVGTGVGINAMLSLNLGRGNKNIVNQTAGNGIFLGIIFYIIFMLFGIFASKAYITYMARNIDEALYNKEEVIAMGTEYLRICCIYSFGSFFFAVGERFLQSTGKTMHSTIGQISGAALNIILDYVFIYICNMGVAGAAYATILGQIASTVVVFLFHIFKNKEISKNPKYIKPSLRIIGSIYKIGIPAAIMQALLAIMMFITLEILGTNIEYGTILQGAFGIYYKIMQMALFACFGLSNTLISLVSFNMGLKNKERVAHAMKYGILDSIIVSAILTIMFQVLAKPISSLFGLTLGSGAEEVIVICNTAMHIATLGYIFMAVSVSIQGILQGFNDIWMPIFISLFRLVIFIIPFGFLFLNIGNPKVNFWWSLVVSEALTSIISFGFLMLGKRKYLSENSSQA